MAENMECETCGGTDFYKDSGYFYCNECQTQSQEIREHEFQVVTEAEVSNAKRIKKNKTETSKDQVTSWECYNIVMVGLTEQLITLGADKKLKPIVKCLWMKYLQKLEVLDLKKDAKPRLQLINSKRDSDILYGVERKKRKRRKSCDDSSVSLNSNRTRREQNKRKRALAEASYEDYSLKSTQETTSLHNETLTSLKSADEKSEKNEELVSFNRYSVKELKKKKISHKHIRKHKSDKNRTLKCHKVTYRTCSFGFYHGVQFLSPQRLYAILYLGLLINRDQIQLGDFLRFIREGHLTFNRYLELFPEEYLEKQLNIKNHSKIVLFSNKYFRMMAAKMAVFLQVEMYIKVVDLTALCERYCKEMNLPDEVYAAVKNIISKSNPNLPFSSKSKMIPNYEGRAMSIILFTLKLLFGLDGVTEWELSKYARAVNQSNVSDQKMFDFAQWMEYIGYRSLLVKEHHFPSQFEENSNEIDSDTFLSYIEAQGLKLERNKVKLTKEMQKNKELLTKIVESQDNDYDLTKYTPTLTPFLEYSQMLNSSYLVQNYSFQDNSLDFLLRPNNYLSLVSDNLQLKHGGANDNWVIEDLRTRNSKRFLSGTLQLIPIEISKKGIEKNVDEAISSKSKAPKEVDPLYVQRTYDECRKHVFQENKAHVNRISKAVKLNDTKKRKSTIKSDRYNTHYMPYERYWLYIQMQTNQSDFDIFFDKHSDMFKYVVRECARIIEQTPRGLFYEFQFSELFLVFCATYCGKNNVQKKQKLLDRTLKYHVDCAKTHW